MYMINHQQYHFIPQQMMPINNGQLNQIPNNNPHLNNQATIAAYTHAQNPHNNQMIKQVYIHRSSIQIIRRSDIFYQIDKFNLHIFLNNRKKNFTKNFLLFIIFLRFKLKNHRQISKYFLYNLDR